MFSPVKQRASSRLRKAFRIALCSALAAFLGTAFAHAHPVSQGSMDVLITPAKIVVTAHVPVEEALIPEGGVAPPNASAASGVWPQHGAYLLQHLEVKVDDLALTGALTQVTPPVNSTTSARIGYRFEYALPSGTPVPRLVALWQSVLNDFEYAAGNPWEATFVTTLRQEDGTAESGLLFTSKEPLSWVCHWDRVLPSATAPRLDRARLFWEYLRHGVMHILTGYDHLLFMAGLVLAVRTLLDLVKVVTAFTIAHTVTLTLSVLNIVRLPSTIVEPVIAASIVFVALQNVFWPSQSRGWMRLGVAFAFGLFHGLGFAGGLLDAMQDLPGVAVATAIVAFSTGVEIGHQAVVLPLYFGLRSLRRRPAEEAHPGALPPFVRAGSAGVCLAGVYYLLVALR